MSTASEPTPESEKSFTYSGFTNTTTPEPEQNTRYFKPEPESHVEPMPEWSQAIQTWGFAWDVHRFGLGAAFAVLAILAFASVVRLLVTRPGSNQKKVSVILLGFITVYGVARSVLLCVDAYHYKKFLPVTVVNILWGVAQPCLITSYTLLYVVLRNAIRLKQRFQTWFTTRNMALVTIPHFLFVFGAELAVSFSPQLTGLTFACQLLYAVLSLMLATFYATVSALIHKSVAVKTKDASKPLGVSNTDNRVRRIICVCIAVAIGGMLIGATQVYIMAGPFSVFSDTGYASAWPWFALTTVMRLLEVYMATLLFVIAQHQSSSSTVKIRRVKRAWTVQQSGQVTVESSFEK